MAATKQKCSVCRDPTNYHCITCQVPVCNICSVFEEDEESPNWKAGKSVAHCVKCKNNEHETMETAKSNLDDNPVQKIQKLKDLLHSSPNSSEEETKKKEESEDSNAESDESMEALNLGKRRKKQQKGKKKPGRKSKWSTEAAADLIDIIVEDDNFKTKLIFQNTKNQQNGKLYESILKELKERGIARGEEITFSSPQLRTKFKKCVQECKKAALTIKTASGIKRFQDSKNYGSWFSQLFAVVKTRDSCQPDQAIEPSGDSEKNEKGEKNQEKLFVPVKGGRKNKKLDNGAEAVKLLKQIVESDTTKNVIDSLRDEMEKSREHELKLFQMMCQTFTARQQEPHQEHFNRTMTQNVPSLSSQLNQANQQPPTAFVNQGFQSNLHMLQPVFQPPGSQPFSTSFSLSGEHSVFDHPSRSAGY